MFAEPFEVIAPFWFVRDAEILFAILPKCSLKMFAEAKSLATPCVTKLDR